MSGYAGVIPPEPALHELVTQFQSSNWQENYLTVIQLDGFQEAHRQLLNSIKHNIEGSARLRWLPLLAAREAFEIHRYYLELAQKRGIKVINQTIANALFVAQFGPVGQIVVNLETIEHPSGNGGEMAKKRS